MGLSGLGDLVLTCGSSQSRNMSLGRAIGQGKLPSEVLAGRVTVAEGVHTATAAVRLAREKGIEMPITEAVQAILEGSVSVDEAIGSLMQRPFKAED
jgi:glycerol-3-phosphate dehydrogenase (NAD(P)+)